MTTAKDRLLVLLDELTLTPLQRHWVEQDLKELSDNSSMEALKEQLEATEDELRTATWENDDLERRVDDLEDELREAKENAIGAYEAGMN